jgi:hypothetical protein
MAETLYATQKEISACPDHQDARRRDMLKWRMKRIQISSAISRANQTLSHPQSLVDMPLEPLSRYDPLTSFGGQATAQDPIRLSSSRLAGKPVHPHGCLTTIAPQHIRMGLRVDFSHSSFHNQSNHLPKIMPRAPKTTKSTKSTDDIKPYIRSSTSPSPESSSPTDPPMTPPKKKTKKEPSSGDSGKKRAWTSEEYLQLFEKVSKAGGGIKTWEGAVEGRTANQCYQAWL